MTTLADNPGRRARQRGITLIETMVAAVVLLIGCGATMSVFSVAVAQISSQGDVGTRVTQYAQDKMEQLMVLNFHDSSTDTTVDPPEPTGGTGLGGIMAGDEALGGTNPSAPVVGYVDYLDDFGQPTTDLTGGRTSANGVSPPTLPRLSRPSRYESASPRNWPLEDCPPPRRWCAARQTCNNRRPTVTYQRRRASPTQGFSVFEAMVSIAILIVLSGAAMSGLIAYQKIYRSLDLKTDLLAGLRGASELMSQEIGQAGLLNHPGTSFAAPVAASLSPQEVTLASTSGIFVGEKLLVDAGVAQETVTVTDLGSTTVTGIFQNSHDAGAPVKAIGVFPQGVLSSSTASQLQLLGDINGDGTLVYVQYDCDAVSGTLSRSITPITADSANPPQILLTGLVANASGAPCFQYRTASAGGYTFVTNVGMAVTIQTSRVDPQTGELMTLTNTFNHFAPRNVWAGLEMAQAGIHGSLQPTPPGVPLQ